MNIVIYRVNSEELEQILETICLKLDISSNDFHINVWLKTGEDEND